MCIRGNDVGGNNDQGKDVVPSEPSVTFIPGGWQIFQSGEYITFNHLSPVKDPRKQIL